MLFSVVLLTSVLPVTDSTMSRIYASSAAVCLAILVVLQSCFHVHGFRRTSFILLQTTPSYSTRSDMSSSPLMSEQPSVPQDAVLESPIILYDGVCNFCNAWVDILLRVDVNKRFKFAPLQSDTGRKLLVDIGKDADDISSVLLIQPNLEYYEKSAAPLRVVEELGPLAGVLSRTALTIVPKEIRDSIYDTVAENRYNLMGKRDECRCSDPRFADRFVS